ncbi:MAG: hypothetical protein PHO63_00320 [Bacilli bacterium]|nr:hypothetical protein [Bacilli bacterium]MDD4808685.1 hypothetical protein [Bacilli bacterium]
MEKKLPSVYANRNMNNSKNNERVYYSHKEEPRTIQKSLDNKLPSLIGQNVEQKINTIFASSNYIYKADVEITLDTGKVIKRVIGRNNNNLVTMDNELIPINKIIDIEYKK